MISIDNENNITMTRSDSLLATVQIEKNGEEYIPQEGDYIRFALSRGYKGQSGYQLYIDKQIPNDTLLLELTPEDTSALDYGTYKYDIELTYADGRVDTFISSKLKLTKEVK